MNSPDNQFPVSTLGRGSDLPDGLFIGLAYPEHVALIILVPYFPW